MIIKKNGLGSPANILIRLMTGLVFLSEGIQKFLFPQLDGTGRFAKIGIPYPGFLGPLTGATELVCGALLIIGLFTRLAVVPLLVVIGVAIYSTKLPMLSVKGFWPTMHESRADVCMLFGLLFLLLAGPGKFSVDNTLK